MSSPHPLQDAADTHTRFMEGAEALVAPLTAAQFRWKPAPERWSVAECLVHVERMNRSYLEHLAPLLTPDAPRGTPPFRYNLAGRMLVDGTGPGEGLKLPTVGKMDPAKVLPGADYHADVVLGDLRALHHAYRDAMQRSVGLDLGRIKVRSPLLPLVRFSLGAVYEGVGNHALRHLDQARRVTEEPGFPPA